MGTGFARPAALSSGGFLGTRGAESFAAAPCFLGVPSGSVALRAGGDGF